jgi:hypothetical protein
VMDRGWTARQPDGTPVGELPLRPGTVRTLRAAGVGTVSRLGVRERKAVFSGRFSPLR